jgi:hypothetical protein
MSVKVKTRIKKGYSKNLMSNMGYLLNADSCDPNIVENKYEELIISVKCYFAIINKFMNSNLVADVCGDMVPNRLESIEALNRVNEAISAFDLAHEVGKVLTPSDTVKYNTESLISTYNALSANIYVKAIITKLSQLKQFEDELLAQDDSIFTKNIDLVFEPFYADMINIRDIYYHEGSNEHSKKFVMLTLNRIYVLSMKIYKNITSPNVSEDDFFSMIDTVVEAAREEIGGVDEAIKVIHNSKNVLKKNFNEYYLQFKISGNPSVFLESYVEGIKKERNLDDKDKISLQFRKICKHYRGKMESNSEIVNTKEYKDLKDIIKISDEITGTILDKSSTE